MADTLVNVTLLEELINPQVMADMVGAELEYKLRATEFFRVDRTLTGRAGDSITIPAWKYIGPAQDLPENTQGEVTEMQTEDISYSIKKAVKNVALTDEAVLSGYGDPVGEATKQLRMSIQDKIDNDAVELLGEIDSTLGLVHTATTHLSYDSVVEAVDLLREEEQGAAKYLLINHTTAKNIRLDPQFYDRSALNVPDILGTGIIGAISGCWAVISNKLTDTRSYILTPECLTVFMKRDINIERERQMLFKRTIIGSDCHFVVAIEDYTKIVAIEHKNVILP